MHLWSMKMLAMSETILELKKYTFTILNLDRYVHVRS
jgi:hypothetical protein